MFNQHGVFHLELQGNIVFADISGPWNAETANAYSEALLKAVEPLKGKPWAAISDINRWELCTPDCETLMANLILHCREIGLRRDAIVSRTNGIKLELLKKKRTEGAVKTPADAFERAFFSTQAHAKAWLMGQGYSSS